MSTVLITGGCGFIGSHQAAVLLEAGHEVVIVDDLSNSTSSVVSRIAALTGRSPAFFPLDVRDTAGLAAVMTGTGCSTIVHFAGRKHVAESMLEPLGYLSANVVGLVSVLNAAGQAGIRRLLFSSSGSVYGNAESFPIQEDAPVRPTNPYSQSKAIGEQMLASLCRADDRWSVMALRYFNPAGAHSSGLIGESSTIVSNLVPAVMEVAAGQRAELVVHGVDHPTPDGTAIRDYIHVMDVAEAHLRALELMEAGRGYEVLNIGRGVGVSVREVVAAAERVTGRTLRVRQADARPGDVPALYGDTRRAQARLGPQVYRNLDEICGDAWRFKLSEVR